MRSAILFRMPARVATEVCAQAFAAAWAASRAFSTSSAVERATSQIGWPVTGVMSAKYCSFSGGTQSPPMKLS
jgi:hypothetical protein